MNKIKITVFILLSIFFCKSAFSYNYNIITHNLPPFTFVENDEIKGFAVDLVKEMMEKMNINDDIIILPFIRGLKSVQEKDNCVLFITARRPERENSVKWIGSLITNGVFFYKKTENTINLYTLNDIKKLKRIGVARGNADHHYLKILGFKNLYPANDQIQTLKMLLTERVDVIPIGELVINEFAKQNNIDLKQIEKIPIKLYDSNLYLAFSLNIPDVEIQRWQNALNELHSSGSIRSDLF